MARFAVVGRPLATPAVPQEFGVLCQRGSQRAKGSQDANGSNEAIHVTAPLMEGRTIRTTRPGVDVTERSEPAGLFRLACHAKFRGVSQAVVIRSCRVRERTDCSTDRPSSERVQAPTFIAAFDAVLQFWDEHVDRRD
jgi:hypothetical protein